MAYDPLSMIEFASKVFPISRKLFEGECKVCGSKFNLEVHHVKHLRKQSRVNQIREYDKSYEANAKKTSTSVQGMPYQSTKRLSRWTRIIVILSLPIFLRECFMMVNYLEQFGKGSQPRVKMLRAVCYFTSPILPVIPFASLSYCVLISWGLFPFAFSSFAFAFVMKGTVARCALVCILID
jgi:hypothetical protein